MIGLDVVEIGGWATLIVLVAAAALGVFAVARASHSVARACHRFLIARHRQRSLPH